MTAAIPARFQPDVVGRIGHGGEATVYELTGERVLRVFHKPAEMPHLTRLAAFYDELATHDLTFAVPHILEHGSEDGISFSLDRRIRGRAFHDLLPTLSGDDRLRALDSFTDAASALSSVRLEDRPYGEFLFETALSADTWPAFLLARLDENYAKSRDELRNDIANVDYIVDGLRARIRALPDPPKVLVHGDYFPGNVMMDDNFRVTGVIDFGWLTVAGDAAMDLASAAIFLNVVRGHTPGDAAHVEARLISQYGDALSEAIAIYRGWYAVRFSPYRADDESLYQWCLLSLRQYADGVRS